MDKITLKEMVDYAKEIVKLCNTVETVKSDEEIELRKKSELKMILFSDWCKRFESKELAKFALNAIISDKDEWGRDDSEFLEDILGEVPMKNDAIYDLEATMLTILYYVHDDAEYFD